ncbi:TlpA family protein disulfide reductase [Chitinophaga sp. 30R24]|uniref:TlpA family protein disulfide reductase n=1 Tax=Chitinophaga sp. 30R24 TaxID=3248838 RepID=UPI003B90779B
MNKNVKYISIVLAVGILLYIGISELLGVPILGGAPPIALRMPEKTGKEGAKIPQISLLTYDSTLFNINDLQKEKPLVLFYFSAECAYCQAELEAILRKKEILNKIQLCLLTSESFHDMKMFYDRNHLNEYTNIKIGVDYNNKFISYFNVTGTPYVAIYGRDKLLKGAFSGILSTQQIKMVASE